MNRLARATVRHRIAILVGAVLFLVAAGAIGGDVQNRLKAGGFDDPHAEATRAAAILTDQFHQGTPNFVLVISAPSGSVDDAAVAREGQAITAELVASPGVAEAFSYWSLQLPLLRSTDGRQALVVGRLAGDPTEVKNTAERLVPLFKARSNDVVHVGVTGEAAVFTEMGLQILDDLKIAEMVAFPLTLLVLIFVFRSVVAAALPLLIGAFAILGTFLALRLIGLITDVSVFALNLTTALGLGLAIDYSLFLVSRYREELGGGLEPAAAVARSLETAGRTVLFSALTVAVSLSALLVFPLFFLRSFAYAGIAVVGIAAVGALVVLPALLVMIGRNIDRLPVMKPRHDTMGHGVWHRLAQVVMRRPVIIGTAVIVVLVVLGLPFLHVRFGLPDDRVLPTGALSRQASQQIRDGFQTRETASLSVVVPGVDAERDGAQIGAYAQQLSALPSVSRVDASTGSYVRGAPAIGKTALHERFARAGTGVYLSVVPEAEPMSAEGEQLVSAIRTTPAPFETLVTGPSAQLVDAKASILSRLPLALALITLATFTLLFAMFGGLLVAAKAVVMSVLSLTATFGAMVWIFQEGHGADFLNFTPIGLLDTTTPILMFCIAFGLSMDYEVFLLSRVKEEFDATDDPVNSVAIGLEYTGRIVTASALLLAIVFLAFATSQITFIKMLGIGLTLAVLMDATLIRGALVPALMRLAGRANWWAPPVLRRVVDRLGLSETESRAEVVELDREPSLTTTTSDEVPV
jgi:RND superfamily putative drug exporter